MLADNLSGDDVNEGKYEEKFPFAVNVTVLQIELPDLVGLGYAPINRKPPFGNSATSSSRQKNLIFSANSINLLLVDVNAIIPPHEVF